MAPGSKHKQEDWGSNPTNAHKCQVGGGQTQETPEPASQSRIERMSAGFDWEFLHQRIRWRVIKEGSQHSSCASIFMYICAFHTHTCEHIGIQTTPTNTQIWKKGRKKDRPKCSTAVNNDLLIFWSKTLVWKMTTFNSNVLCAWALNLRADFSAARVLSIPFLAKHSF